MLQPGGATVLIPRTSAAETPPPPVGLPGGQAEGIYDCHNARCIIQKDAPRSNVRNVSWYQNE